MAVRIHSMLKAIPAAVAIAMCLLAARSPAQGIDPLPDPCKVAGFTADEQAQIQSYVQKRIDRMDAGVPEVEKARSELNAPLQRPCVSVAFRQFYRAAAIEGLTRLAADSNEDVAINALYVLSQIADDPSRQVIQQYTADPRAAVRYAAITSLKYAFAAVDNAAPALDAARVSDMVRHLGERLAAESDPVYVDAIARGLLGAASISRDGYTAASTEAITILAQGIGTRLRAAAPEDRPVLLVTSLLVGEALSARLANAGDVSPDVARAGAAFAGEILGDLAFLANGGELPESRRVEIDLTILSERILVFAHSKLGRSLAAPGLGELLQAGSDKEYYSRVRGAVLSLDGPPCNLPAEAMQRIRDALEGKN